MPSILRCTLLHFNLLLLIAFAGISWTSLTRDPDSLPPGFGDPPLPSTKTTRDHARMESVLADLYALPQRPAEPPSRPPGHTSARDPLAGWRILSVLRYGGRSVAFVSREEPRRSRRRPVVVCDTLVEGEKFRGLPVVIEHVDAAGVRYQDEANGRERSLRRAVPPPWDYSRGLRGK